MSKADEMFKELGYKKYDQLSEIVYIKNDYNIIIFNLIENNFHKTGICMYDYISNEELTAINEKVKELDWLDVK